jgi:hypothetical protein
MKQITAFTWEYWGWGTHAEDFVRNVDESAPVVKLSSDESSVAIVSGPAKIGREWFFPILGPAFMIVHTRRPWSGHTVQP